MARLDWGGGIGLHFRSNEEYYETLGFLTKKNRPIDIYTHDNSKSGAGYRICHAQLFADLTDQGGFSCPHLSSESNNGASF